MTKPLRAAGHPIVVGSAIREMKEKLDAALVIHRTQQQQVSEPFFRAFICKHKLLLISALRMSVYLQLDFPVQPRGEAPSWWPKEQQVKV